MRSDLIRYSSYAMLSLCGFMLKVPLHVMNKKFHSKRGELSCCVTKKMCLVSKVEIIWEMKILK